MRVSKITKSDYYLRHICLSVSPFAWNSSAVALQTFMKFDISGFFENLLTNLKID